MSVARHPRPPELVNAPLEDIMQKYVGRFREKKPDWAAFEDAKIEGYKRAQHRFIGAGGSGKHTDPTIIPASNFTLSIMYVEPGQGNAAHTHEVEECFFVLQGFLDVFVEDESGKRLTTRLGPWECISCPAGVIAVNGFMQQFLSQQANASTSATQLQQGQDVVVSALQLKMNSTSGVNIDTEMSNLISIQNTYAANAHVMSVVQTMMTTLMQVQV